MAWRIQSTVEATKSSDPLYYLYFTSLQSHLEVWLGIIGASLPTLAPIASKLIVPAFSRLISSHRKIVSSLSYRKNANPTMGGSGVEVPLQDTGFTRLEDNFVESSGTQPWGKAESTRAEGSLGTDMDSDAWNDRPDAITVRHDYNVFAEPRQGV